MSAAQKLKARTQFALERSAQRDKRAAERGGDAGELGKRSARACMHGLSC